MPLLTYNVFVASGSGYQRPNFDGYISIHYAAPPYSVASAPFISSRLAMFGWVRRFGFRVQRVLNAMQNLRRLVENTDPILSRLWTKVHEIFRRCRKPLVLSNALFQLSVSRLIQKKFAIKSRCRRKTEQIQKFFDPNFCGRDGSDFSTAVC